MLSQDRCGREQPQDLAQVWRRLEEWRGSHARGVAFPAALWSAGGASGAHVGDVFMSLIHTAELNDVAPFESLGCWFQYWRHHARLPAGAMRSSKTSMFPETEPGGHLEPASKQRIQFTFSEADTRERQQPVDTGHCFL